MKTCIKCGKSKALQDFYKHPTYPDGLMAKCKDCHKANSKENYERKSLDPVFIESERIRSIERYHRLGYVEKQKEWDLKRPWTKTSAYKGLNKRLRRDGLLIKGQVAHHWNYNLLECVIILDSSKHRMIHKHLHMDNDTFCFKTDSGELLDTKDKHIKYIANL